MCPPAPFFVSAGTQNSKNFAPEAIVRECRGLDNKGSEK